MFAVVPVHVTETSRDAGGVVRTQETLVASEGHSVLPVLVAPVAITLLAVFTRRPVIRIAYAAIFDAACFLALLSIGAFYLPAAIALTIAAAITPRLGSSRRVADQISGSPGTPSDGSAGSRATGSAGRFRRGRQ
jgi:hypothetical protein